MAFKPDPSNPEETMRYAGGMTAAFYDQEIAACPWWRVWYQVRLRWHRKQVMKIVRDTLDRLKEE